MDNDDIKTGNIDESGAVAIGRGASAVKTDNMQAEILSCVLQMKETLGILTTHVEQQRKDISELSGCLEGNGVIGLVRRVEILEQFLPWIRVASISLVLSNLGLFVLVVWHIVATTGFLK